MPLHLDTEGGSNRPPRFYNPPPREPAVSWLRRLVPVPMPLFIVMLMALAFSGTVNFVVAIVLIARAGGQG